MGQIRADAHGPEVQQRAGPRGPEARPLSPHLQVWRWHVTMFCSIANRATGIALYVGFLILAGWAVALASGPDAYQTYMDLLASLLGKLVLFGLTLSLFFHLAGGLRHFGWDTGHGYAPKTADATGWIAIAFTIVASMGVWTIAWFVGLL
jgi:succinate dehydrogenase / fumarate reductase cytochrome b subunit